MRTGVVISSWRKGDRRARPLVYFGDQTGNVFALKARTGRLVWRIRADEHRAATTTGTPTLYNDVLYIPVASLEEGPAAAPSYPCCSFRGSVLAVDSLTGKQRWRTYLVDEPTQRGKNEAGTPRFGPSGVGVWSAPAIDAKRGVLYVTTGDNYSSPATAMSDAVVALGLGDGRITWAYQTLTNDAWNMGCVSKVRDNCPAESGRISISVPRRPSRPGATARTMSLPVRSRALPMR